AKAMTGPRVAQHLDRERLETHGRLHEPGFVLGDVVVLLGEMDEVRRPGAGEVDLLGAVERDGGGDGVSGPDRGPQPHRSTHAEPDHADRPPTGLVVDET